MSGEQKVLLGLVGLIGMAIIVLAILMRILRFPKNSEGRLKIRGLPWLTKYENRPEYPDKMSNVSLCIALVWLVLGTLIVLYV